MRRLRRVSPGKTIEPAASVASSGSAPVATAMIVDGSALTAAAERQDRLTAPVAADVARAGAAIPDATLSTTSARSLAASATWGGTFTASTGEQVHIRVSDSYPQDPAVAQRWANFLAALVHG